MTVSSHGVTTVARSLLGSTHTDNLDRIQEGFELHEWGQQAGQSPILWAQYLRKSPLPGIEPKAVVLQFATADQQAVNPANLAFMRAGDLSSAATLYRHNLAFAIDPTIPKNPHMVPVQGPLTEEFNFIK